MGDFGGNRLAVHGGFVALLNHASFQQYADAIRQEVGFGEVVRDKQYRQFLFLPQLAQQPPELASQALVQGRERFVE